MITQIAIALFGASAIWFVGRKEEWKRWGYILGLLGQPFWFYSTITGEQWGIFALCLFYTYSWSQGVWNYWLKPWRKRRAFLKKNPPRFKPLKPCGAVTMDPHPCDFSHLYICRNCELGK